MSGRKLNSLERELHQFALTRPDKVVTQKALERFSPSPKALLPAINFLLGTGLFVVLIGEDSAISYRAVTHDEIEIKKGLNQEEVLVIDRIRAAGNEGIWTKHIKAKTQLHQVVVDKCLKSLTQKQLIKTVNDVRHSARKIYMLSHLEPSTELTGGPWFTDNELDTEFIKLLSGVCLKIIRDRSFPKTLQGQDSRSRQVYPLSYSSYPNAQQILNFLKKSGVTETDLTVEHIQILLEVLIWDGKIEKIPALHIPGWDIDNSEHESLHESQLSLLEKGSRGKKRARRDLSDDSDRGGKRKKRHHTSDSAQATEDDTATGDDDRSLRKRRRKRNTPSVDDTKLKGKRRKMDRSSFGDTEDEGSTECVHHAGGVVYRAVYEERVSLGLYQAPCVLCPTFEFCKGGGPVNPRECVYYDSWLTGGKACMNY
ncbi:uncharacterized protein LAESUDRAFT_661947 [Laetiporus sulphureus 93-53]|uniref:DNA-directed RNA polymerase III subunit RPC6 n=1 Tax=Laetiporus sulphureus 93-53 TaxID=1314785 RepID=A0A165C960_9APHY|nr:uncharacterized protein LAESUDRAFT_661947 [Laetiporus sulphureus 93-53]KZT02415.1 hypothetical protein LAESUDRAFT_661947 [Laetiporus sulphureus 93-53]